jgi:hypothetical protein
MGKIVKKFEEEKRLSPKQVQKIADERDESYKPENIKETLEKNGLSAEETILVTNPVTGRSAQVKIERDGTPDSKLILALADKTLDQEQKDHVLSMYLYERGRESSSFIVDLMRSKGQHTKETRAFKSQMRFDFEMFVSSFVVYLQNAAQVYGDAWGFNPTELLDVYVKFIQENKGVKKASWKLIFAEMNKDNPDAKKPSIVECTNRDMAVRMIDEAESLMSAVKKQSDKRQAEKGYGIYIGKDGKAFGIFDENFDHVVKEDREAIIKEEENKKS